MTGSTHLFEQRRQAFTHLARPHAADQCQAAGNIVRIERLNQPQQIIRIKTRAAFQPMGWKYRAYIHMGTVNLTGTIPIQSICAVVENWLPSAVMVSCRVKASS